MKNKILRKVQEEINEINEENFINYIGQRAVVIIDKMYEIVKINSSKESYKLSFEDDRGRFKADKYFNLIVSNDTPFERVDLAFVGDTLLINRKNRIIKKIDENIVYFEDGFASFLPLSEQEKEAYPDYLLEIGFEKNTQSKDKSKKTEMTNNSVIKEKLKDYKLVPLFPSTEISDAFGFLIREDLISFFSVRKKVSISFMCTVAIVKKDNELSASYLYNIFKGVPDQIPTDEIDYKSVVSQKANLPDLMNFYNEFYAECVKKFNAILSENLKDELEKEKEKQKKKEEQKKQDKKDDKSEEDSQDSKPDKGEEAKEESQDGESEKGEKGEEGEEGEQESQDGESEKGEKGDEGAEGEQESQDGESEKGEDDSQGGDEEQDDEGGEMSSEDIQKMIDEISKSQSSKNEQGQSQNGSENIDLEDFLNDVEKGNDDNDFTKNYDNKDLKSKIDAEKKENKTEQQLNGSKDEVKNEFEDYEVKDSLGAIKKLLEINTDEIKRRFPTKKSIIGFITSLSKTEIDTIASQVGIPNEISNIEKQKQIANNLSKEINI